jgi:hypothetical protein
MASRGKKKTTMAKLTRESRLRERRIEKKARKEARKLAPVDQPGEPVEGEGSAEDDREVGVDREAEVAADH